MTVELFEKISELWFAGDREVALSLASHVEDQFELMILCGRIWDNTGKVLVYGGILPEVNFFGTSSCSSHCIKPHMLSDIRVSPDRNGITKYYTSCFGRGNQAWDVEDCGKYILLMPIQPHYGDIVSQKQPLRSYTIDM